MTKSRKKKEVKRVLDPKGVGCVLKVKTSRKRWLTEKPDIKPCISYKSGSNQVEVINKKSVLQSEVKLTKRTLRRQERFKATNKGTFIRFKEPLETVKNQKLADFDTHNQLEPNTETSVRKTLIEQGKSDFLANELNGYREVKNPAGRVDVLTSEYVIEVKEANNWKHAIGQILVYSFYYPNHKPMLYLFGDDLANYRLIAQEHCKRLGIIYTEEK